MGPFDDTSRGQLNVDQVIGSGLAATQPVATTTTGGAPGIPQAPDPTGGLGIQSDIQVQSPEWAGLPSQQDFAQVDVRRGNYNTGIVPTVNVQMPFAALANRQAALGQRKAALDKQVKDFDLYSKVGSPDARYAQAFNKYATQGMDQKLNDFAVSMHGGDRRAAIRDIATNPESRRMWESWSREFQAVADESKKWMSVNDERLAKHFSGEATIKDPKALDAMMRFAASVDENRTPIGANGKPLEAGDFVRTAREAVPEIQKVQYMEEVLGDSMKDAVKTMTGIDIESRRVGGNIVLSSREVKDFEDAIKAYVDSDERWVNDFNDGDKKRATEFVRAFFPISVKEDIEFKSPSYAPEYMVNQQQSPQQAAVASVITQPGVETAVERVPGSSVPGLGIATKKAGDVTVITPQKVVGKNVTPIYREALTDEKGNPVEVAMPALKYDPSKGGWEWQGRSLTEKANVTFTQLTQGSMDLNDPKNVDKIRELVTNESNLGPVKSAPASQNEAANLRMIGFRTPQEYVASILNQTPGRDIKPEEVDELMKNKNTRDLVNAALSGK